MLNPKPTLQRYNLARCALLRFVSSCTLLTDCQQQRLANWQRNFTIDDYSHLKPDERNNLLGTDVFRRLRVSDRRAVRRRVPFEHFERDQSLPIRRCERNERGGRARSDDECENPVGLRFGIVEKFIVRVFYLIRVAMLMITRLFRVTERDYMPYPHSSRLALYLSPCSLLHYSSLNLSGPSFHPSPRVSPWHGLIRTTFSYNNS